MTYRFAHASKATGSLIESANCVDTTIVKCITANMSSCALPSTISLKTLHTHAFGSFTAGFHTLSIDMTLLWIDGTVGNNALTIDHSISCIASALIPCSRWSIRASLVRTALRMIPAFV